jgi:PhoH-like ATPase
MTTRQSETRKKRVNVGMKGGNGRNKPALFSGYKNKQPIFVRAESVREGLMFGLDTNILMTNSGALWGFKEHNLFLPFEVLLELDKGKRVEGESGYHARHAIDSLIMLAESVPRDKIREGIPLIPPNERNMVTDNKRGRLFFGKPTPEMLRSSLDKNIPDHAILLECLEYKEKFPNNGKMILVSKDKVMRIVALLAGFPTEDYFDDAINTQNLQSSGVHELPFSFLKKQKKLTCEQIEKCAHYSLCGNELENVELNEFLCVEKNEGGVETLDLHVVEKKSSYAVIAKEVVDYTRRPILDMRARNREQSFALNALLDPEIFVVILEGPAGCGKNFIALLAAYYQIFVMERYEKVVATRDPIAVGQELGFKPGTERDKMASWMGGMIDNTEQMQKVLSGWNGKVPKMAYNLSSVLELIDINSIRGRSLHKTIFIFDENQNSTRKQQQLVGTRIAQGSKIVFLGNFTQADKLLNSRTSGLARLISKTRGWKRAAHIVMPTIERGEVAEFMEKNL